MANKCKEVTPSGDTKASASNPATPTILDVLSWTADHVLEYFEPLVQPFGDQQVQIFRGLKLDGADLPMNFKLFSGNLSNEVHMMLSGEIQKIAKTGPKIHTWDVETTLRYATPMLQPFGDEQPQLFRAAQLDGQAILEISLNELNDAIGLSKRAASALYSEILVLKVLQGAETLLKSPRIDYSNLSVHLKGLYHSWNEPYYGDSVEALTQTLIEYEKHSKKNSGKTYCKMLPIIQSSGMGKSRTVAELGKRLFTTTFTLRVNGSTGYPPGDPEVTRFVLESFSKLDQPWFCHARAVALMGGIFQSILGMWELDSEKNVGNESVASAWSARLQPQKFGSEHSQTQQTARRSVAEFFAITRSQDQKTLSRTVEKSAGSIFDKLAADQTWKETFNKNISTTVMSNNVIVQQELLLPAKELVKKLKGRVENPLVVIAFDEASLFFPQNDSTEYSLMSALRRVLQLLKPDPIWTLVLSTSSSIDYFALPDHKDPSSRINSGSLQRVGPFYTLMLDIHMYRRVNDPSTHGVRTEWMKPLAQFATAEHMSLYGRPLWYGYKEHELNDIRDIVLGKLIQTSKGPIKEYNSSNSYHVFAALAARVSLDPCLNTEEACDLAREAVNSHLRIILDLHSSSGLMRTITPIEPLVSEAVAFLFMDENKWVQSIKTLTDRLLNPGLIEKGLRGELFGRLIIVLSRDYYLKKMLQGSAEAEAEWGENGLAVQNLSDTRSEDEPNLKRARVSDKHQPFTKVSDKFSYALPFNLLGFLEYLFGGEHAAVINDLRGLGSSDYQTRSSQEKLATTLGAAFKNALMNFTHFTSTETTVESENIKELLHCLMHTQSALQLKFQQLGFDLMIPVYLGDPKTPFDTSKLTAMLIQLKNKNKATKFIVSKSVLRGFFPEDFTNPILVMLLDVGVAAVEVKGVQSCANNVYGLYASGQNVFQALRDDSDLAYNCNQLFGDLWDGVGSKLQDMNHRNARFNFHTWVGRFPNIAKHTQQTG